MVKKDYDVTLNRVPISVAYESTYKVLKNSSTPHILIGNSCLFSKLYIDEVYDIIKVF